MIIQTLLAIGLLLVIAYAYLQRSKSRLVSSTISLIGVTGLYFVFYPQHSTNLAHAMGVGRGADLIIYCWILISLAVSLNLQFKILRLYSVVTELVRELAIRNPQSPNLIETEQGSMGFSEQTSPATESDNNK